MKKTLLALALFLGLIASAVALLYIYGYATRPNVIIHNSSQLHITEIQIQTDATRRFGLQPFFHRVRFKKVRKFTFPPVLMLLLRLNTTESILPQSYNVMHPMEEMGDLRPPK